MRKIILKMIVPGLILFSAWNAMAMESQKTEMETSNYQQGKKLYDTRQFKAAYPYLLKAAEEGNSDAMMHLGKMFFNGWGVGHNHETGRMWHEKAAKLGNPESIRKLKTMDMHDHR